MYLRTVELCSLSAQHFHESLSRCAGAIGDDASFRVKPLRELSYMTKHYSQSKNDRKLRSKHNIGLKI